MDDSLIYVCLFRMGEKELWREFYCKGEKGNDIVFGGESRVNNFFNE